MTHAVANMEISTKKKEETQMVRSLTSTKLSLRNTDALLFSASATALILASGMVIGTSSTALALHEPSHGNGGAKVCHGSGGVGSLRAA
jgi:hypothetical protein